MTLSEYGSSSDSRIDALDESVRAALDDAEHVRLRDLAREAHAAAAEDAALVVELDARAEVVELALVVLRVGRARARRAVGEFVVLQTAFARLVADPAVHRVIEHEELHHLLACAADLGHERRHFHVRRDRQVARGHQLRDAFDLDEADAAAAGDRQARVVAEVRDLDAVPQRGLQHALAAIGLDGAVVDREFHGPLSGFEAAAVERAAIRDKVLELVAELLDEAQHRHRGGVAEGAQRVAENPLGNRAAGSRGRLPRRARRRPARGCRPSRPSLRGTACTGRTIRGGRSGSAPAAGAPCTCLRR